MEQTKTIKTENGKKEFQKIVALLVEYDERTGRIRKSDNNGIVAHHLRKAASVADINNIEVTLTKKEGYIYTVTVSQRDSVSSFTTSWTHEDGIAEERIELKGKPDHPVHTIVCLSDLFTNECE